MSLRPGDPHPSRRLLVVRAALGRRRAHRPGSRGLQMLGTAAIVLFVGLALAVVSVSATGVESLQALTTNLPTLTPLSASDLAQTTRIYDRTGTHVLAMVYTQDRDYVPYAQIPKNVIDATVAIEDRGFWTNSGIDIAAIARAALNNAGGGSTQGASTITQQLVKQLVVGDQQTLDRKIREALLAERASQVMSKQQIMELYLNTVYYGEQAYGISAAARHYFGVSLSKLTLAQAALLAGLPKAPEALDPFKHPAAADARQHAVLDAMVSTKAITPAEARAAKAQTIPLKRWSPPTSPAPWFTDRVIEEASAMVGGRDKLATCGCRVITTLDLGLQKIAQRDVTSFVKGLPAALNVHNAALVAQDPATGEILAYVGSVDPHDTSPKVSGQFDSAGQALRSPGSTWKLVTYLAAMENGHLTDASPLWDVKTQFAPGYVGEDSEHDTNGLITIRQAIRESRNIPAIRAMLAYGGLQGMQNMAMRLGLTVPYAPGEGGPSSAIGTHSVHLTDMTQMYSTESNLGVRVAQHKILRIEKSGGKVIQPNLPAPTRVVDAGLAWEFLNVLQDNANKNKGWLTGPFADLGRPAAVKTGTETDMRDLYTVGMVPQMVAGVWVGNADNSVMASSFRSNIGPLVLWRTFMADAVKAKKWKPIDWQRPSELVAVKVCADFSMFAGYGFDQNGTTCPFGRTETSWVIPGFNDPATRLRLAGKEFGTFLTDGNGHQLPARCTVGVHQTGILAKAELPQWQHDLDVWVERARRGLENRGGYNFTATFPWSRMNWILPAEGTSCPPIVWHWRFTGGGNQGSGGSGTVTAPPPGHHKPKPPGGPNPPGQPTPATPPPSPQPTPPPAQPSPPPGG